MVSLIVLSTVAGLSLFAGIFMLITGKGSWLIAGYNTACKAEKKRYNEKKLCKFIGLIFIITAGFLCASIFGLIFNISMVMLASFIGILATCSFAIIFSNASKKFKA